MPKTDDVIKRIEEIPEILRNLNHALKTAMKVVEAQQKKIADLEEQLSGPDVMRLKINSDGYVRDQRTGDAYGKSEKEFTDCFCEDSPVGEFRYTVDEVKRMWRRLKLGATITV